MKERKKLVKVVSSLFQLREYSRRFIAVQVYPTLCQVRLESGHGGGQRTVVFSDWATRGGKTSAQLCHHRSDGVNAWKFMN